MASLALPAISDDSGYTPSIDVVGLSLDKLCVNRPQVADHTERNGRPQGTDDHVCQLGPDDLASIESAVAYFRELNQPVWALSQEFFPLSDELRRKLSIVHGKVRSKQGFVILRGIDPFRSSDLDSIVMHVGLMTYLGGRRATPGSEGGDRTVLHHVTELPAPAQSQCYHGPPNQARDMPFHTDDGDIVSLFMRSRSDHQSGGNFYLANATRVMESLSIYWPDSVKVLEEDWDIINVDHSERRPLIFRDHESGRFSINCSRARLTGTRSRPRPPHLPSLTEAQMSALDRMHAASMVNSHKIEMQPGDLVLFDNLRMLHARDAFVDDQSDGRDRKRHLLRVIVEDNARKHALPEKLAYKWRVLYDHERAAEVFPVKPELFSEKVSH